MRLEEAEQLLSQCHREIRAEVGPDAPIEVVSALAWARYEDQFVWLWQYWWKRLKARFAS